MLLRMKQLPGIDNLRNYPVEIIKGLEDLLLSGASALPDPKRKGFYDVENRERTYFIQISSITAAWAYLQHGSAQSGRLRLRVALGLVDATQSDKSAFRATFR